MEFNLKEKQLLQEIVKKYKQGLISGILQGDNITLTPTGCRNKIISSTSSGIGGGIQSIQEGTNITVDNTDPLNPIISATDSSSALFPNGVKLVTSSRDFQSSDIGKILVVTTSNVHLTMPLGTTFGIGTIFGLKFLGNLTDCDFESTNGTVVKPLITVDDGEFIIFSTGFSGSNSSVGAISGQYILDNGIWKTDLKYLYDKSQNAIPLSGTEIGKPVIGDVEVEQYGSRLFKTLNDNGDAYNSVVFDASGIIITGRNSPTTETNIQITDFEGKCLLTTNSPTPRGYSSLVDCTPYIGDLDYTQKKYVDELVTANSVTPLSSLSPATSANVIDNGNKTQEWQWNSLTSGIGLKLSSNSTAATSNSQTLFSVNQSGANATTTQTTYGAIFSNTKTGTSSTNIGLMAIATGATNNIPIYAQTATSEVLRLQSTGTSGRWISYWDNTVETGRIGFCSGNTSTFNVQLDIVNKTALGGIGMFVNTKTTPSLFVQNSGAVGINNAAPFATLDIVPLTTNNYAINISSGGMYRTYTASNNSGGFELLNTTFSGTSGAHIQMNTSGVFSIFHSASTMNISTGINLTSTNDVGIGASPSASAKLEVSSTTQGFLPPRMTTTQKNAIPTPAEGLEVYDLTLHQKSYYNGTIWVNI